jgi:hypothetical protein
MSRVFIIGLPKLIRNRVEAALRPSGVLVNSILVDRHKKHNILTLLPELSQAPSLLRAYYDGLESYDLARVYVLPFVDLPEELERELDTLEELGGEIVEFVMGEDGCPAPERVNPLLDQPFQDGVVKLLVDEIVGVQVVVLPSVHLQSVLERAPTLIPLGDAINLCDAVSPGRYAWMNGAIDALVEIICAKGQVGEFEAFFSRRGIKHAQTGGITVSLDVARREAAALHIKCNTHLKVGDKTTPQSAARLYYHAYGGDPDYYIFLLYLGPHPERDISRTHQFD